MNVLLTALLLSVQPAGEAVEAPKASSSKTIAVQKESQTRSGADAIASIRKAYNEGQYREAFKELDDSYREIQEKEGLSALKEMRIGSSSPQKEWEELLKGTLAERNAALRSVVNDALDRKLADKVISAIASRGSAVEDSLSCLAKLHTQAPGAGKNDDENRIIAIDFEYEYKALHLDMPLILGQKGESLKEKQLALKMEMFDKMLAASKEFKDDALKQAIEIVHANLDTLLQQNWDMADLHKLINKPDANALEENIANVLTKYREKFSDLSKMFVEKQAVQKDVQ